MQAKYLIPDWNMPTLEERIARLNKRAVRLGVAEITVTSRVDHLRYEVSQPQVGLVVDGNGGNRRNWLTEDQVEANRQSMMPGTKTGRVAEWMEVEVTGTTPMLAGWALVAVLEPLETDEGAENLLNCLPGEHCPQEYRHRVGECDHCHVRRKRSQTFVVRNEAGEHKSIGRQCLKDFLGGVDPHALAAAAELLAELQGLCAGAEDSDGYDGNCPREAQSWDLERFLAITCACIDKDGWMSKSRARELFDVQPTATSVMFVLSPPPKEYLRPEDAKFISERQPTDAHRERAAKAIEWAKSIPEDKREDYLGNVNTVARAGYTTRKTTGLAASIISAYGRAVEDEVKRQELAARPESHHVGTVGKRDVFTVTCNNVISSAGSYGVTGIHKLTDDAGNDMTWFASEAANWLSVGKTYKIKATVKEHGEFRGRKQTTIQRLAVVSEVVLEEHVS